MRSVEVVFVENEFVNDTLRLVQLVGVHDHDREVRELFNRVFVLAPADTTTSDAIAHAPELLRKRANELANHLIV